MTDYYHAFSDPISIMPEGKVDSLSGRNGGVEVASDVWCDVPAQQRRMCRYGDSTRIMDLTCLLPMWA